MLASGEALLLRILPEGEEAFPDAPGARTVVNPCLSGGAVEVFLEPMLPAPLLAVVGTSPIADAVAELAEPLGFAVSRDGDGPAQPAGATAVLISSHGRFEEESIRAALDAGVGLIGLVASHTRGAAVLDGLGLTDEERARVRTPIGVEIGATTAGEIALSIMAEIVRAVRVEGLTAAGPRAGTDRRPGARPGVRHDRRHRPRHPAPHRRRSRALVLRHRVPRPLRRRTPPGDRHRPGAGGGLVEPAGPPQAAAALPRPHPARRLPRRGARVPVRPARW